MTSQFPFFAKVGSLSTVQMTVSFDEILRAVRQLPDREKMRLGRALERDTKRKKLTELLAAFATDKLDEATIARETEKVRSDIFHASR